MKTFDDLKLIEPIQRALADAKYTEPTTIQFETIPPALVGRDLLGCAQTGTGKTAAFGLPILHKLGSQNLNAVLTNDLWSQSLTFSKTDDNWISNIQKPEIIDTDYTVYLEFCEDSLGILQAKIQSNKSLVSQIAN